IEMFLGCEEPPRNEGLLRLYSMKFCPYAQRARLVLNAKKIPHDVVNIDLSNRPDWYYKNSSRSKNNYTIHLLKFLGKVPTLLDGSKILIESLIISDYLDEKYPENPLYSFEPEMKRRDKELVQKIDPAIEVFYRCLLEDKGTPEEWLNELLGPLGPFEEALGERRSIFFGGDTPGMVDYMLWPWAERVGVIPMKLGVNLPLEQEQIPLLCKWRKAMRKEPICDKIYNPPETFWKVVQNKIKSLKEKSELQANSKVPALLDGDKIIVESLDISDYLDEKYPENPLYPAEPEAKSRTSNWPWEWLDEFLPHLQVFEDALAKRGTPYFGGEKPGMVDYMLWPWGERAEAVPLKLGAKLPLKDGQLSHLRKWKKDMLKDPISAEIYTPPKTFYKLIEYRLNGTKPDYDNL
ncbi:hypothetical protein NQ317_019017, partial [Molorchus minor]